MSARPHTAGPWQFFTFDADFCSIENGSVGIGEAYSIPDARLIAAAPELLWALQQIVNDLPRNRDWLDRNVEAFAKQALAKATGAA